MATATVVVRAQKPAEPAEPADVIFSGGTVLTMDPAQARAEAVAVRGEEIVAVGPEVAVMRLRGAQTRMIDLGGRTLLPGFNDAHGHRIGDHSMMGLTQEEAIEAALRAGFTSISEMFVSQDRLESLQGLDAAGKLRLRVNAYLPVNSRSEKYGIWFDGQYTQGQVLGPHVRIAGAKLFVDNNIFDMLLSQPHANREAGYYGRKLWTQDELNAIVKRLSDGGWQIAAHALGDGATDMIPNAYTSALPAPDNGRRFRVEHLAVLRDDQINALKQYRILASIQLTFFTSDWLAEPRIAAELGPDRLSQFGRWHDLVEAGIHVVGSTDRPWDVYPCSGGRPCSALDAVAQAVTRIGVDGLTPPPYMLAQRLTVEQALEAMTTAGAYSTFEEKTKGAISQHKLADLVILDQNPLTTAADNLRNIGVVATIVGGHTAYCAAGAEALCP